jgi:hypothetical protein
VTIFVVMGTRGEYSEREEWPVCAYTNRALADKHADEAMLWWKRWLDGLEEQGLESWEVTAPASPWDAREFEFRAPDYFVLAVEMREALPEVTA